MGPLVPRITAGRLVASSCRGAAAGPSLRRQACCNSRPTPSQWIAETLATSRHPSSCRTYYPHARSREFLSPVFPTVLSSSSSLLSSSLSSSPSRACPHLPPRSATATTTCRKSSTMAPAVVSPPTGVFVPVPTFFQSRSSPSSSSSSSAPAATLDAQLDIDTQVAHSVHLARSGIRGLVLLGSTGEAIHLSRAERSALVAGVRRGLDAAGFPGYPIMAGVLTNAVDETLEWLRDYAAAGAQWGLVLVPGYFGAAASQENIKAWYTLVADHSPIPILIYNYPGVTNNVLVTPETYSELAQHPKIVGCKMSHGNVSYHVQVSLDPQIDHAKFRVYSGFGQQLGPIVYFGAAGVIDGLAAFYPKTVVRLMALAEQLAAADGSTDTAAQRDEARRLQYVVSRAEEFVGRFGIVGIKEAVYRVTGLGNLEGGRLPLRGKLPEGEWERARATLLADIEKTEAAL